jgi:hypothetical protein
MNQIRRFNKPKIRRFSRIKFRPDLKTTSRPQNPEATEALKNAAINRETTYGSNEGRGRQMGKARLPPTTPAAAGDTKDATSPKELRDKARLKEKGKTRKIMKLLVLQYINIIK